MSSSMYDSSWSSSESSGGASAASERGWGHANASCSLASTQKQDGYRNEIVSTLNPLTSLSRTFVALLEIQNFASVREVPLKLAHQLRGLSAIVSHVYHVANVCRTEF